MRIELLFWEGCPSHPEALELLQDVLDERGIAEPIRLREVFTHEDAVELDFPGPYVLAWEGRINAPAREYAERGVRIVAVSSNDAEAYPADSFDEMVERAREAGYVFDYVYDESQDLARALGSARTPEAFVFDADRRLVYHGAVDDNREEADVTTHYLRDAIKAALAGEAPEIADTPPVGCTVKWRS